MKPPPPLKTKINGRIHNQKFLHRFTKASLFETETLKNVQCKGILSFYSLFFFFFLLFTFILKKTTVYHPFSFFFFKFTFANVLKAEITHKYKGFTEGNDVISSRSTDMIDKLKTLTAPLSGAIHCPHTTVYHHEYKKEKKKMIKPKYKYIFWD